MFYMQIKYLTNAVYLSLLISQDPYSFFVKFLHLFSYDKVKYTYHIFASGHIQFNARSRK